MVANLRLIGTPFLAAFYSKDLIIELTALRVSQPIPILATIVAAGLTASYTVRFIVLTSTICPKAPILSSSDQDSTTHCAVAGL